MLHGIRQALAERDHDLDRATPQTGVDILAYPRKRMRLTELATPLKPLEAMAQGRLVAASNAGGTAN